MGTDRKTTKEYIVSYYSIVYGGRKRSVFTSEEAARSYAKEKIEEGRSNVKLTVVTTTTERYEAAV